MHLVASVAQRWLLGTHQGAVKPAHLQDSLDELAFRFNRRNSRSRSMLFYRLLGQPRATPHHRLLVTDADSGRPHQRPAPGKRIPPPSLAGETPIAPGAGIRPATADPLQ